jgi:hypothetical protein
MSVRYAPSCKTLSVFAFDATLVKRETAATTSLWTVKAVDSAWSANVATR